jgi:DNA-binding GntR family transcriptional regulator
MTVVTGTGLAITPLVPSAKPRKADTGYERLREMIVTLALEPGAPIDERALMERLGVGRTPLREGIQRLTHEGLIVQSPRRGRWVAPLSVTDLGQMIETRRLLEPQVARLAAVRVSPNQVERLGTLLGKAERLLERHDFAGCVFLDQAFHTGVAEASGNRHLIRMTDQILHELVRYWFASFVRVGHLGDIFPHHRTLLAAVAAHDADAAERLAQEHIDLFRDRIRDLAAGPAATATAQSPNGRHPAEV